MDISALITKTIAETTQDQKRFYIGASSIGNKCERAIWYGYKGAESTKPTASIKTTFDIGKRLEGLLLDYMQQAGMPMVRDRAVYDVDFELFQGHCDAIALIDDQWCVVEIKTANTASFSQFKSKGLKTWMPKYYSQIQAYLGMSGYKRGVLLAIDKNTSALHHEWVNYDDIFYNELLVKAKRISESIEPPEKLNKNPIFYLCNMCSYRKVCHVN